jgi:hypothetical protein
LPFQVIDLTVEIVQTFSVKPSLDVVEPLEQYKHRFALYKLSEDPTRPDSLKNVIRPDAGAMSISRQSRVPYEEKPPRDRAPPPLPSHHPASQSCIMPSTEIVFTLLFEQYEGGVSPSQEQLNKPTLREVQIRTEAILSSCFLRREYMELPAYNAETTSAGICHQSIPKGRYGFSQCMCKEMSREEEQKYGVSQEEMLEHSQAEEAARAWLESSRAAKGNAEG